MSTVEFEAGINGISINVESIDFKMRTAINSSLAGWLAEAQKTGATVTVSIMATAEDDRMERQLRLFEDAMVTDFIAPKAAVAAAAAAVNGRRGRRANLTAVSEPGPATTVEGEAGEQTEQEHATDPD